MRRAISRPNCHQGHGVSQSLLLLALSLPLSPAAQGQEAPGQRAPLLLKITPQYVVVSGYWLEVERSWRQHPGQSFTLTPQLYAGPAGHPDAATPYYQSALTPERRVRGAGLQAQHRIYLKTGPAATYPTGLYASYGVSFQHFAVSYAGQGWQEVQDPNGLPYLELRRSRHTETTSRYGATGQAGYQVPLGARVLLDVYAGLGWRTGQSRSEAGPVRSQYRSGPSDYGHLGLYFPAGFKIGVAL
ncbi:hypothetical protein [uncultured Hymenobacter sp.]|uniref:hypothetical protein n=1 Tax=uncultured Hymenobacter sp. TaxID=170016 RepID=UPI0035CC0423